jgi:hypothetical protein
MFHWHNELHLKWGDVVRVQPDELIFVAASAWSDIYEARPQLPKPELGAFTPVNGVRPVAGLTDTHEDTKQR